MNSNLLLSEVLDQYDTDELVVVASHDSFIVEHDVEDGENEWLWQWDPAHDGAPLSALETLFEEVGLEVEHQ